MQKSFNTEAIRLSKALPADRRREFVGFVMTGEASKEFITWLETDMPAQAAAEQIFALSAKSLEALAREVKASGSKPVLGR